jgi:anthranilate phosphoribosyltransferase
MTALVVAGAGVPVCKHGNRSASSACGTADVLEALGARIEQSPEQVARNVAATGFGFVFAPAFHPAFRHVGPVRRELGVPTVFNLLGPMANPAHVAYMLVGVANDTHLATMASVLAKRTVGSLVVHGHGGLDELSLAGPNRAIATGVIAPVAAAMPADVTIDAGDLGLDRADNDALRGGDAVHNAQVVTDVLNDRLRGPIRDVVVLNAGVALFVARAAASPRAGIELAEASIAGGRAKSVLDAFVAASNLTA